MKVIIILTTLICIGTFANSESHSVSTDRQDFSNAIRFVEKKEFSAAIEIFEKLSKMDYPEAQYNLGLFYFNGLGTPKNFKMSLYWSWQAYLNGHEKALDRVDAAIEASNDNLRDIVARQIAEELLALADQGNIRAPLKLGRTYLKLFVQPDAPAAYLWLSISQAYGEEMATSFLEEAASQLTLDEILAKQDEALEKFNSIKNKKN